MVPDKNKLKVVLNHENLLTEYEIQCGSQNEQTCINETSNESTNLTPLQLMCNKKPTRIWTQWLNLQSLIEENHDHEYYLFLAKQKIKKRQARNKKYWDKNKDFETWDTCVSESIKSIKP